MKRITTLAVAALVLLPAVAAGGRAVAQAAAPDTDAPQVFVTNFDNASEKIGWTAHGDATAAQALDRTVGDSACGVMMSGAYGALRSFDVDTSRTGRTEARDIPYPTGTWAQAEYQVRAAGPVDVQVTWSARNVKDCADCLPAVYVGDLPLTTGGDLDQAGTLSRSWQQFRYEAQVDLPGISNSADTGRLFVAIGWMGGNATMGLDCITVKVARVRGGSEGKAAPATARQPSGNYFYNFESGLAPWGFAAEGTYGLLQQGHGQNGCSDLAGSAFASIQNMAGPTTRLDPLDVEDFPAPRGAALYMIAPFAAAAAQVSHVELDFASRTIEGCEGCTQLVYVGNSARPHASDFKRLSGFKQQWAANHFEADLAAERGTTIYIGLGWQGPTGEQPELPRNVGFDCLSVRIHQPDN